MTTERQCKAKPGAHFMDVLADWMIWAAIIVLAVGGIYGGLADEELHERVTALEAQTSGRQQGVSAPECPPVEESDQGVQVDPSQQVSYTLGPLAQSVEQRTFNPLSACNQYQPEAKLGGFSREFDAIRAPCCARLHVDRVSAGCQEVER